MKYKKENWSIDRLMDMLKEGEIDDSPEFQRNYVWDDKRASLLIDSLIGEIPLDPIILHNINDAEYSLVDGKQRLTSIKRFIDNELTLSYKREDIFFINNTLKGKKKFKDLTSKEQKRLTQITLDVVIITDADQAEIRKFFKRKNVGGLKLTNQEIRSGVSGGKFKNVLKRLQEYSKFKDLWGIPTPFDEDSKKQKTDENILKFFSFYRAYYDGNGADDYKIMSKFLDENIQRFAEEKNDLVTHAKEIKDIEDRFMFSVKKCHDIFYSDATLSLEFQPFRNLGTSKTFNWMIAIAQLLGFALIYSDADNDGIRTNTDKIRLAWVDYLKEKEQLLAQRSNDKDRIREFFGGWFDTLYSILKPTKIDRFIQNKLAVKLEQFNTNKTCAICNNQILSIKLADLHHVIPASKGGGGNLNNLRLTHYNCNRALGNEYQEEEGGEDDMIDSET